MKKLPGISVIIVTLNNQRTIEECLRAISKQDYPKKLVEYINVDGGSTDKTLSVLRKYSFKTIKTTIRKDAEAQRGVGLRAAKHNIIISLDADNYLPNKDWIRQMVQPFIDDPSVVHANTMHYAYRRHDTIFNRYCGLLGMADPIVFYVGRPDRLPQYIYQWNLGKMVKETKEYYLVDFSKKTLPTVGCNGVAYRKDVLLKYAKSSPAEFLHIDVFADLIDSGFTRFAIVKNTIVHDTAASIGMLIRKRIAFLSSYYLKSNIKRRYLIYDPNDPQSRIKLLLFVLYTVTFVKPCLDALRGFIEIPDVAWFMHPIACWIYLYSYSMATIKRRLSQS